MRAFNNVNEEETLTTPPKNYESIVSNKKPAKELTKWLNHLTQL